MGVVDGVNSASKTVDDVLHVSLLVLVMGSVVLVLHSNVLVDFQRVHHVVL